LHYGTLMDSRACVKMAAAAWGTGFLNAVLHTANTFSIPLCQGNTVDQFFCEVPQILKLSCSDSYLREVGLNVVSGCLGFGCFVFIVVSYVQIFTAVLRMPSEQGRHKAFSMCLPHLAVVSLFVSTGTFAYLKPPSLSSPALDLVVAVLYTVVPPPEPLLFRLMPIDLHPHIMHNGEEAGSISLVTSWPKRQLTPLGEPGSGEAMSGANLCAGKEFLTARIVVAIARDNNITKSFSTGMFTYMKPPSLCAPSLDLVVAVLYSVVPPAVNPLIYSMRNKELKEALSKLLQVVLVQQQ
ncbi:olfactory receptor 14A16-like, partial [Dromaius novaehollandiae]|uniref:olfactory receptor 14A16-like n=1 Tax=Dromaius novaehollandiae TaxID=8790 RepID=UPI0031203CC0